MATQRDTVERFRDATTANLHPAARDAFTELAIDLQAQFEKGTTKTSFRLFEGYRSPIRQNYLFNQEPKVTHARAWESAHNFGLACDFVAYIYVGGQWQWSWDDAEDWPFLKKRAEIFGLTVPITWDRGHVEHPKWRRDGPIFRNA